jgi:hypothetical protein
MIWLPHTGAQKKRFHMTSETKIESNRKNASRSTGPKTARGKTRASRNAWRHGLAVVKRNDPFILANAAGMARAICRNEFIPALYEQAVIIAECEISLLKLRAARLAIFGTNSKFGMTPERSDKQSEVLKTKNWKHTSVRLASGEPGAGSTLDKQTAEAIQDLQAKLGEAGCKDLYSPETNKPPTADGPSGQRPGSHQPIPQAPSDARALQLGLGDLATLDRYERRTLSRRNRAIRTFAAISIVTPFIDRKLDDLASPAATA